MPTEAKLAKPVSASFGVATYPEDATDRTRADCLDDSQTHIAGRGRCSSRAATAIEHSRIAGAFGDLSHCNCAATGG